MQTAMLRTALAVLACLAALPVALLAPPARADAPFVLSVGRSPDRTIHLRWSIAPGNYLYRDRIAVAMPDGRRLPLTTAPGVTKDDPNFGPVEVYHDRAEASLAFDAGAGADAIEVSYQGCAERGICYPPVRRVVDLATLAIRDAGPAIAEPGEETWTAAGPAGGVSVRPADSEPATGLLSRDLPVVLVTFLGLGLLLALTPCVLPMVPILSGMLARSGERLSAARGFVLSAAYALAMALAYGTLGVAAAWSGQNLQSALQTPLALGLLSAVFVALALSMFGLFDLQLPAAWNARLSRLSGRNAGAVGGAVVIGFTSALIVGPCVTPPLAAALLYVAQTGDVVRGAAALFALGLGMGLPLVAFGTFGAGILPRSGPWLVRIKQAFGVVFLALAVSMLSRVVPGEVALGLWGLLAVGVGVFAGAFDALAPGSGTEARLGRSVGLVAATYGCALVLGAASGSDDPLRPLAGTGGARAQVSAPSGAVTSVASFDAALRSARSAAKPILVEFAADWCSICKDNERTVLSDPTVRERLRSVSVIRADVTRDDAESRALMRRFRVVGPPTLILLRPSDGTEIAGTRTEGTLTVDGFARTLAAAGA